jgi:hypothetical protein
LSLVLSILVGAPRALAADDSGKPAAKKHEEGALDRFEADATRPGKDRDRDSRDKHDGRGRHHDCDDDCDCDEDDDFAAAFFFELGRATYYTTIYGGMGSLARVQGSLSGHWASEFPMRAVGEPLIPFVSVDGQMQDVGGDVSAAEVRVEAGYGPVAVEVRRIGYRESRPEDVMTIMRAHFLYRMSFSRSVEVDLGYGFATLSGNRSTNGPSLTTPLRVYPTPALGFELRPSWAWMPGGTVTDCSLLAVARKSVVSVKAGYRWTSTGNIDLDGPVVGLAVHF